MIGAFCLDPALFDLIYGDELRAEIAALVDITGPVYSAERIAQNPGLLREVEVIFSGWGAPEFNAEVLSQAPKLRAVFYGAGSVKGLVSDAFWERGIELTSAYAMNAVPVTEYSLAMILLGLRSTWQQAGKTRAEKTFARLPMAGGYGSTVGLVSLGMIGKMVAERLKTYEVKIIAYDPFVSAYPGVEMVSLEQVFAAADVVSLHTPWLKETEGLVTGAHIESMKPYATFINTSRGAVVCEEEMVAVLARRPDLTAVLDVTHPEPPAPDSPLYTLPNVILTPHIAGSVNAECRRMGRLMIAELQRYLKGEPFEYRMTKERVAIMA
jgi:phosphoglycerate dehydrogenase-like enzyme